MNHKEQSSRQTEDTHQHSSFRHDTSDASWEQLAAFLEAFVERWESDGFGPQISDHLPGDDASARRLTLIELIKLDLEYRYASDGPVLTLEDYADEYPELVQPDGIPADLIYEEYHVRKAAGIEADASKCLRRFPDQAEEIRRLFQLEATSSDDPSGRDLSEAYQPGDHIGDFYLMSALGTGAFGSVFLARQESMQRMVALKVSRDKGTEGQTLAQLDHPHIVRVYDQVRLPDQNLRLLYMQFVAGGTLQSVIRAARKADRPTGRILSGCIADAVRKSGVLSPDDIPLRSSVTDKPWAEVTCRIGMELADALHYAHSQGVLHRDVKPANVLLAINGTARLADFNISFGAEIEGDDPEFSFGGSLAYMSPEQLRACHPDDVQTASGLDGRSDVYSLGLMLWELMYGTRPFDDQDSPTNSWKDTLEALIQLRRNGPPAPSRVPVTDTEQRLLEILRRCLAFDLHDRIQSAQELGHELSLCLQPRVARLLHRSESGWRKLAAQWPLTAFLVAAISPHGFAAVFNHQYNDVAIIRELPGAADDFLRLVLVINGIAFPVGFAFCIWFIQPVVRALKHSEQTDLEVSSTRVRALQLSRFVTVLGITEWIIAGLAYPVGLHVLTQGLAIHWHLHFFGSLLICGLLAAAYPFFLTATLSIRVFLPKLIRQGRCQDEESRVLQQLAHQSGWSLYLAGGVPAVGAMILLTTQEADAHSELTLKYLSVLGAFGFAFTLSLARSLQSDIEALQEVYRVQRDRSDAGL